jgi:hypothetical protein
MSGRALWVTMGAAVAAGILWAASGRGIEVLLGVTAPVLTTAISWVSVTRAWATAPASSLAVMIRGFAVKAVFFIAWVTIVLKGFEVRPEPFVASLTVSFLVLHLMEAWHLKRLMQT